MQVGIPVAYNVCEVKLDKINHWVCVNREDFQLRWCIEIQVKSRISYWVCRNTERSDRIQGVPGEMCQISGGCSLC